MDTEKEFIVFTDTRQTVGVDDIENLEPGTQKNNALENPPEQHFKSGSAGGLIHNKPLSTSKGEIDFVHIANNKSDRSLLIKGKPITVSFDKSRQTTIKMSDLQENLKEFTESLHEIIPNIDNTPSGYKLKTVTIALGVNGKGQVGFLGIGAEVGGTATLTLTFER